MERRIAEQLIELALSLDEPLNRATTLSFEIADAEEQKAVRRAIAETTGTAFTGLIAPIVRQFPDLDPEKASRAPGT